LHNYDGSYGSNYDGGYDSYWKYEINTIQI
jgi:hypothetical protein